MPRIVAPLVLLFLLRHEIKTAQAFNNWEPVFEKAAKIVIFFLVLKMLYHAVMGLVVRPIGRVLTFGFKGLFLPRNHRPRTRIDDDDDQDESPTPQVVPARTPRSQAVQVPMSDDTQPYEVVPR